MKQPKCSSTDEQMKKTRYICTMEYYSAERKKGNLIICDNIDGPWGHYAKRNQGKVNIIWSHLHVESKES